jgi:hypothetical protein
VFFFLTYLFVEKEVKFSSSSVISYEMLTSALVELAAAVRADEMAPQVLPPLPEGPGKLTFH